MNLVRKTLILSIILMLFACASDPKVQLNRHPLPTEPVIHAGKHTLSDHQVDRTLHQVAAEGSQDALERHVSILSNQGIALVSNNQVDLFVDGPPTFQSMYEALEQAQSTILVESYIFDDSPIGQKIGQLLQKKARAGIDVFVIYDSAGSMATDTQYFEKLRKSDVVVCEYNPINPIKMRQFKNPVIRDHRKIMVIDQQIAYVGGINISHVYAASSAPHFWGESKAVGWRDTHIRINGPASEQFANLIFDTLLEQKCIEHVPVIDSDLRPSRGDKLVAVLESKGGDEYSRVYQVMLAAIEGAESSIYMTMAYFSPDDLLIDALVSASKRGVDVHLLLPGETDWPILKFAGQSHFQTLLNAGVRIHQYQDGMLHAKTVVIDGVWSTVGSTNLDWRSLVFNDEVNAVVLGQEFGHEMTMLFVKDLEQAETVTLGDWKNRGMLNRLREFFAVRFERWL